MKFGTAFSREGSITTTDVTFTLPYTGTEVAAIDLAGSATHSGVSATTDLMFYVDAVNGVTVDSGETGYGIVGTNSALNISISKDGTTIADDTNVDSGDVTVDTTLMDQPRLL